MPRGQRFYYRHASQVVDGTRCNDESLDVCVNGKCQVSATREPVKNGFTKFDAIFSLSDVT